MTPPHILHFQYLAIFNFENVPNNTIKLEIFFNILITNFEIGGKLILYVVTKDVIYGHKVENQFQYFIRFH